MLTEDDLVRAVGGERRRLYVQAVYLRYVATDRVQSFASLAEVLDVTRQAVQRRSKKGLQMLRHPSRRRFVCAHLRPDSQLWQALFDIRDARCSDVSEDGRWTRGG